MDRDHIVEREIRDEDDGRPVLVLLGYRYGIQDSPTFVAERIGDYVRLTDRGVRELHAANRRTH